MSDEEHKETSPGEEPAPPQVVTLLETELAELKDCKEKYWLLLADTENHRKRLVKEKADLRRFAVEGLIVELLQPLDQFEQALGFAEKMSDEVRNWATGFDMILNQLRGVLESQNVKPYSSKGSLFDPHLHEAVEAEETTEVPDGTILEEFTRGYKMGDRIIRAARVKVAKAPKPEPAPEVSEQKQEEQEEANSN